MGGSLALLTGQVLRDRAPKRYGELRRELALSRRSPSLRPTAMGKTPAPGLAGDGRPSPANSGHPSQRPTSRPHRRRAGAGAADESPRAIGRHTHRRHRRWEPARGAVSPFHDAHCTSPANGHGGGRDGVGNVAWCGWANLSPPAAVCLPSAYPPPSPSPRCHISDYPSPLRPLVYVLLGMAALSFARSLTTRSSALHLLASSLSTRSLAL